MLPRRADWIFTFLFLLVLTAQIVSASSALYHHWRLFARPALAGSIVLYLLINFSRAQKKFGLLMLGGFLLCLAGDVFLQQEGIRWFTYGLEAFLAAHVLFSIAFTFRTESNFEIMWLKKRPWTISLLAGYGIILFHFIKPRLGNLTIPMVVYLGGLLIMVMLAMNRHHKVPAKSFQFGFAGALLFMVSDTLLALDKFREPVANDEVWIMATYGLALVCLMHMAVLQFRAQPAGQHGAG